MARPKKEGLDYFPFDVHMEFNNESIEDKHGTMGFAVFVKLLQHIYGGKGYYCDWSKDIALRFMRRTCPDVPMKLISEVINTALNRGIFDKMLHRKYQVLTSKEIQDRYFEATYKRELDIREELLLTELKQKSESSKKTTKTTTKKSKEDKSKGAKKPATKGNSRDVGVSVKKTSDNPLKEKKEKEKKKKESKEDEIRADEIMQSSVGEIQLSITLKDGSLYHIRDSDISRYSSLYSQLDILQNLKNMVGWFDSNPDKRRTKDEIQNFINSWFRRELKSPPPQLQQPPSTTAKNSSSDINKYFYDDYDEENDPFLRMFDDE